MKKIIWRLALVASLLFLLRTWLGLPEVRQLYAVPHDKYVHVAVFFLVPCLLTWIARWPMWILLCVPIFGAGVEEYLQSFEPGRSCDFADWEAGVIGVVAACVLIALWRYWQQSRITR
ncbi:VanZ family protein [Chitinibacter sp. SCUT-21]|uniref:VanZ family protein n=1 Tax=Chitinibacter sp. SCUT-21 TaxID=2970891 RepID=UPI0035A6EDE4